MAEFKMALIGFRGDGERAGSEPPARGRISLSVGPDRDVDPLVALVAEESESHGGPDQVDDPARRSEVL